MICFSHLHMERESAVLGVSIHLQREDKMHQQIGKNFLYFYYLVKSGVGTWWNQGLEYMVKSGVRNMVKSGVRNMKSGFGIWWDQGSELGEIRGLELGEILIECYPLNVYRFIPSRAVVNLTRGFLSTPPQVNLRLNSGWSNINLETIKFEKLFSWVQFQPSTVSCLICISLEILGEFRTCK